MSRPEPREEATSGQTVEGFVGPAKFKLHSACVMVCQSEGLVFFECW
jgi:hypothetical protein